MKKTAVTLLVLVALAATATAREPSFREYRAVQDSLSRVHPRLRTRWLSERGLEMPEGNAPQSASPGSLDSTSIALAGKWGRGPSVEVTGRDSLVFLSLGSEVAIINMADPDNPEVLSEPQAMGLVTQAAVRDSFLYIGTTSSQAGIEIWNIADLRNPVFRNRVLTRLNDFCVQDTLLYLTQRSSSPSRDTFKVYNMADPDNPALVGFCPDSGASVVVSGSTVLLGDWYNIFALDVSDPTNPHRVGQYAGFAVGLAARGSICCAAVYWQTDDEFFRFEVLDISNPSDIHRIGYLNDVGGYDICLEDSLAFVSGYQSSGFEFAIIDIADSTNPSGLGGCETPGDNDAVWADLSRSYSIVADRDQGAVILDIGDLATPVADTLVCVASSARDVAVVGQTACVADWVAGLRLLDISDPAVPIEVSSLDTVGDYPDIEALAADDSVVYVDWRPHPYLRTVSIGHVAQPELLGGCGELEGSPMAIVAQDTLVYTAGLARFQVVDVSDPRNLARVGRLELPYDYYYDICIDGTVACVAGSPFCVVSIADPENPLLLHTIPDIRSWGCDVVDTLLFIADFDDSLHILSVANPSVPYQISAVYAGLNPLDVEVQGRYAYVAGEGLRAVDISDPRSPEVVAWSWTPYVGRRVRCESAYVYVACSNGGVCVFDAFTTPLQEEPGLGARQPMLTLAHTIVQDVVELHCLAGSTTPLSYAVMDVSGRVLYQRVVRGVRAGARVPVSLAGQPAGVYAIRSEFAGSSFGWKVVKPNGR